MEEPKIEGEDLQSRTEELMAVEEKESLFTDNLSLAINLDVYKGKMSELNSTPRPPPPQDHGSSSGGDSALFGVLKQHLQEASDILSNLEKSVDGMQSVPASPMGAGGRAAAAPAISKLIQAFESKTQQAESISDRTSGLVDGGHAEDPAALVKEQTGGLRDVLMRIESELRQAEVLIAKEQNNRERIDALVSKVSEYESVIFELRNQIGEMQKNADEKTEELVNKESDYESRIVALRGQIDKMQQNTDENIKELVNKVSDGYESKIAELQNQVDEMQRNADEQIRELLSKVSDYGSRIVDMQSQIDEMQRNADESIKVLVNKVSDDYESKVIGLHNQIDELHRNADEQIKEIVNKVSDYGSRIVDMQNQIEEMQRNADEEAVRLSSQMEGLQKEVNDSTSVFKQEEDSIRVVIGKLNASTGLQQDDGLDVGFLVTASVNAAVREIMSLHEKVDAADVNYTILKIASEELNKSLVDMHGRSTLSFELLKKMHSSLRKLVYDSDEGEDLMDVDTDESLEVLSRNCDMLIGNVQKLMDEHHHLLSTRNELEVGFSNRNHEIEELNIRCDALANKLEDERRMKEELELILMNRSKILEEVSSRIHSLAQKLGDHELSKDLDVDSAIMKSDNMEGDFYKSTLLRIETLIDFHLQKHEEAIEQINSSKNQLWEANIVNEIPAEEWDLPLHKLLRQEFVPKVSELMEKLQSLSATNLQHETEIQFLKDGLSKMEEALEASRSELNLKVSELEQSELKFSSVREKLSVAVAKGKGLIVQRDSLKQSLMKKSSELEKCMQEIQSKDTLVNELEAKLNSCSEVDRVEALESELSYIRNSATALRDSFLLKDSILQRIEEVLEDLDLPEHFHSKDIVEKIDLLSRMVAGNSSIPVSEWDQKSSEGQPHSDAGVVDAWKDEIQPSTSQEFDEVKRKYEELQTKFYGLAEHNAMLEQSLLEQNSLVQKWEEMLERIDMPSHLRALEPEDRIENLGRAFSEMRQERDALRKKIENLEVSSDMIIADVEESHKKISELSSEIAAVKSEKDFLSESLENLRFQYLELSKKAVHDEVERENLHQGQLVERTEDKGPPDIENEIRKLYDLVLNALPDNDKPETFPDRSDIAFLEPLVRKLIDLCTLSTVTSKLLGHQEAHLEERNLSVDKQSLVDVLHDKDKELLDLRLEFDETSRNLDFVKENRDAAMEKCNSLILEVEEMTRQISLLQEERTHDMEKYQSLVLELEAAVKSRTTLQEQLSQEEQESAAAREKLNLLLNKDQELHELRLEFEETSRNLVLVKEERDAAIEKCHFLTLEVEEIGRQMNLLYEERTNDIQKSQSLVLELEVAVKSRDALQEKLTQEEQKSADTREKLNIAVRKGKGLVQQRDALKQTIEEMNSMMEHLKVEHGQRLESLELEKSLLMDQLAESNKRLQEYDQHFNRLLTAVDSIDLGTGIDIIDPVQKLEEIGRVGHHLHSAVEEKGRQINLLQEERTRDMEKYQSLMLELEAAGKSRDALQERFTWEEQNSADAREKLNLLHDKDQELLDLKMELDETLQKLVLVKEERDASMEKCHSLTMEVEEMSRQIDLLQEERTHNMEKYQSLVMEFEAMDKSRDALQEQLSQEEQKSAAAREKQNLLFNQDRELLDLRFEFDEISQNLVLVKEERDAAIEKFQSSTLEEEEMARKINSLQEERTHDMEKYQDLVLKLEALVKSRVSLQEQLSQEEQKSAAAQAKLNLLGKQDQELLDLRLEFDEISRNLVLVEEERDAAMEKCQSLTLEVEEIGKIRDALQGQLTQEEQKSASAREKLNIAVRKGKLLVQQRDALKQTIEEMNSMMERLKVEHDQQLKSLESERSMLMDQLAESNQRLQEYSQNFNKLLTAIHSIDIGTKINTIDPVQKLEEFERVSRHLHSAVVSSENEAKKSKQAAELLLVELNEVQDTADILQEDLGKAEAALAESYRQKHDAEAAKLDALSQLEQFMSVHSVERKKQFSSLLKLKSGLDQVRKGCIKFSSLLADVCRKDMDLLVYVQSSIEFILKQMTGETVADLPVFESGNLLSINPLSEDKFHAGDAWQISSDSHFSDESIAEHLACASSALYECTKEYADMQEQVHQYLSSVRKHETYLAETLETLKRKLGSQKEYSDFLQKEVTRLESMIKEKESEISSMWRNMSLLYEACSCTLGEIEIRNAQTVGRSFAPEVPVSEKSRRGITLPSYVNAKEDADGHTILFTDESIRTMADSLVSAVQSSATISETVEGNQRELKSTILDLQRELQEKDIELKRISEELVSQIRDAEAAAKRSLTNLESARLQVSYLENKVAELENDKQLLESRCSQLKDCEGSLKELQDRVKLLNDSLAAKDQEIEGLMQALDEEESEMEALENRNKKLEDIIQEKTLAFESLEGSKAKALTKLATTASKFDELHNLSESLLAEIESLESQLRERDSEISFLRQEVTRLTNGDLALQESNKEYLCEINEVLTWMERMVSHFGEPPTHESDQNLKKIHAYTGILEKRIVSVMNELQDLRVTAQNNDALLQIERGRVQRLIRKNENLETTHNKEIQQEPFQIEREHVEPSTSNSPGHVEVEQMVQRNKVSSAPIATHIRNGRKVNNDQVAIAIDMQKDDNTLDDEDDDKAHGFKSLTMSWFVPRATRPISDRIDGIWVSADRLLMRQPSLRLGVIVYWVLLHALLATVI